MHLAGRGVHHRKPIAAVVDHHLLAGRVGLAHHKLLTTPMLAVTIAKLGVAKAGRMDFAILLPQQLQRNAGALELRGDMGHVRLGDDSGHWRFRTTKQVPLKVGVPEL